jgi:hypothetical protein
MTVKSKEENSKDCCPNYVQEFVLFAALIVLSRNLKSSYVARNRFQEPSLESSSQAT